MKCFAMSNRSEKVTFLGLFCRATFFLIGSADLKKRLTIFFVKALAQANADLASAQDKLAVIKRKVGVSIEMKNITNVPRATLTYIKNPHKVEYKKKSKRNFVPSRRYLHCHRELKPPKLHAFLLNGGVPT